MLRHPLPRARLAALALSSFAFAAAHAQPATGFDTAPARLAAEVLGQRPGTPARPGR